MKHYIGSIRCGCEQACGGRIKIYADGVHNIYGITPHGREDIETYYAHSRYAQVIADLSAEYSGDWHLRLSRWARKLLKRS